MRTQIQRFFSSFCCCTMILAMLGRVSGQTAAVTEPDSELFEKVDMVLQGISIGQDGRFFPYVTGSSLHDIYGGVLLKHGALWNSQDRILQSMKYDETNEYSWKIKYLANSLSGKNTRLALLFKLKSNDDGYFYGIGNTIKDNRERATYFSTFVGAEVARHLSDKVIFRISPGFWSFKSGLASGGEFEAASDARYLSTRLSLAQQPATRPYSHAFQHDWSGYLEVGMPAFSDASYYARLNLENHWRLPLPKQTRLEIDARLETIFSDSRSQLPYFTMPEVGSRSGLRGYSKDRFRDYAVAAINLEYSMPVSSSFEAFFLTDMARTGGTLPGLMSGIVYRDFGVGVRLLHKSIPIEVGLAAGDEGWRLFSNIAVGLH